MEFTEGNHSTEFNCKLMGDDAEAAKHALPHPNSGHGVPHSQPMSQQIVRCAEPAPPSYLWLSLVSACCCWPIAIYAVMASKESASAARAGDYVTARRKGQNAKAIACGAIVVGLIGSVIVFGLQVLRS